MKISMSDATGTGIGNMFRGVLFVVALSAFGWCIATLAQGAGVSGYLPLNLAPEIERAVERVLVLGGQTVLVRPVPIAAVRRALPKACRIDRALCRRVSAYVSQFDSTVAVTDASAQAALATKSTTILPNEHGMPADGKWAVSADGIFQPNPYFMVDGGIVAQPRATTVSPEPPPELDPTGTMLSAGLDALQLDVGYRDRWLSPMTDSSMLQSTEGPTVPSVTLSNVRPLTRLGFDYQLFLERMSEADAIVWQNSLTSGHPELAGMHFGITPVDGWSIAANGTWQFGGGARPSSLTELLRSLVGRTAFCSATNATTGPTDCRFANRNVSITSAYAFPGPTPFEAYTEFAGHDTFHGQIYRFHQTDFSAGLHFPDLAKRFDLIIEASEWQNGWYTDYVWLEGMTNYGIVTGNWGAQWRTYGDAPGAQTEMVQLGWSLDSGDNINVRLRTLQNANYRQPFDDSVWGGPYHRADMITFEYSQSRGAFTRGVTFDAGRDVEASGFARLGAFLRFDGDDEGGYSALDSSSSDDDDTEAAASAQPGTERFVDVGMTTGRFGVDTYGFDTPAGVAAVDYTRKTSPHVGLGVRRAVSANNDFGVRVELDNFNGALLAARILDYRYRFGAHLAAGAFFGYARYTAGTPAQGYYAGLGAQWRDVLPRWDVGLDLRYFDRLQRDKLLPTDPPVQVDPVEYYTMNALTLSLSRRF